MRVLLDGDLPRTLARLPPEHDVHTTPQRRWSDLDDGALLDAYAGEYEALVTMDQNLRFQRHLRGRPLGIVVLRARSNRPAEFAPLVPALGAALQTLVPGEVRLIGG